MSLACIGFFGLFTKIRKGYGVSFLLYVFCMSFSQKCSLLNTLSNDQVFRRFKRVVKTLQLESEDYWFKAHGTLSWAFLTVIWLSHNQLWVISKEAASLTQC